MRRSPLLAVALLAGCVHRPPEPAGTSITHFVATSPHNGENPPRDACWMTGRFEGNALLDGDALLLVIPSGWVAVTRDNDKQWDDLHLTVEVSAHPFSSQRWVPRGVSAPIVLAPTVDSAGPQLTTWQLHDTLRLFVPWKQTLDPRWLVFTLDYHALSYKGVWSSCGGRMGTDTLRFSPR